MNILLHFLSIPYKAGFLKRIIRCFIIIHVKMTDVRLMAFFLTYALLQIDKI